MASKSDPIAQENLFSYLRLFASQDVFADKLALGYQEVAFGRGWPGGETLLVLYHPDGRIATYENWWRDPIPRQRELTPRGLESLLELKGVRLSRRFSLGDALAKLNELKERRRLNF